MNTKSVIFIIILSILSIAAYSSYTNFISAVSECFGTINVGYVICTDTVTYSNGEERTLVTECVKDKDGKWSCKVLNAKVMPPGVEDAIKKSMMSEGLAKSTK